MAEPFYDLMPGPEHRQKLNEMYSVWLAALEEALGPRGWSPMLGVTTDGARRVLQIVDWVGGEDVKPTITGYIGAAGIVPTAAEAIDIRGGQGIAGNDGNDGADGPANTLTIGTVQSGATAGAEITGTAPSQTLNLTLPKGDAGSDGADGTDGWTPVWAVVADGERRVLRIDDWTGGTGTKPATGYLGPTGIVATIGDALDIRGAPGSGSVSTVNNVDPDGSGNVSLGISDIPNLSTSMDDKVDKVTGKGLSEANFTSAEKSQLAGLDDVLAAKLDSSQKGAVSGVAPLDGDAKVPAIHLPSYVDDVLEYANFGALPGTGEAGKIYVTLDNNKTWRWSGSAYVEIAASPGSTDAVPEGASNLYHTAARVRAVVLSGLSLATNAAITASDTVLSAFGKLQKQITDLVATVSGKQDALVSGTSIKTVGGQSVLGSGDITIPTLAPIADTADIASLSGGDTITPGSLGTAAAAAGTISGGTTNTFDWAAAVNYTMALTGNRTLSNPTNVLPGTTRVIVVSSSTSTSRTLAFGSNFVGDLPTVSVTNTANMVLFLYAVSSTKIVVTGVEI
ncbi:hypothetical protein H0A65_10865 [Alcaligenaceae bacterium]|nr:hypothetical protein [Alcaligenaceae bacterium]